MEVKKSPKANLENHTRLFWQLGLVLTLLTVYLGIEHKTYEKSFNALSGGSAKCFYAYPILSYDDGFLCLSTYYYFCRDPCYRSFGRSSFLELCYDYFS